MDSTELEIAGERWRLTAAPRHPQPAFPGSWLRVAVAALLALIAGVGTWILLETTARLRRQNLLLEELATIDTLTGVANRRVTLLTAERAFALARRTGHALTLLVVDLDHFKSVNDRYGHQAGDAVLRAAAGAMSAVVRATDLVGRIGGEEFLIVAPGTGLEGAAQLAQRLLHRVEDADVTFGRTKIAITASAGMATLTTEDRDIEDLIARADAGLYQAKHAGRNQAITSLLPEEPSQVIPLRRRGP